MPINTMFLIDPEIVNSVVKFEQTLLNGLTGAVNNNLLKASSTADRTLQNTVAMISQDLVSIDQPKHSDDEKPLDFSVIIDVDDDATYIKNTPLDDSQILNLISPKHLTSPHKVEDVKSSITVSDSLTLDGWVAALRNSDEVGTLDSRKNEFKGTYNLIGQFYQLISSLDDEPDEGTLVTFNENGVLCINTEKPTGLLPEAIKHFEQMIKETYGIELGERILNRYFRDNSKHSNLKELTYKDIKKAFIGASANVKISDLKKLFNNIHDDFKGLLPLRCGELLSTSMIDSIKQTTQFEDLTSEQLNILRRAFTVLPNKEGKCRKTLKVFFEGKTVKQDPVHFDHYIHDVLLLKELNDIKLIDTNDVKLYLSQHIGKKLVYKELQKGMVIPLINEDKEPCQYHVYEHLEYKGDAVIANLITPINNGNRYTTSSDEADIFLTFRGTGSSPSVKAAGASIERDVDDSGVGKTDFHKRAQEILNMVESYLIEANGPITLNLSGHSLAACDTQRALLLISKKITDSQPDCIWRKVKHIVAHTHNSPRLEDKAATEFVKVITKLDTMVSSKDLELDIDLTHVRIFDKNSEDLVQTLWYKLLGANIRESSIFKKRVVKLQFNEELGLLGKHSAKGFMTSSLPYTKTIITDKTENDLLQKVLCERYYWCDDKNMSNIDKMLQNIKWYGSYLHTTPVTILQAVLYRTGVFGGILKKLPRAFSKTRSNNELVKLGWLDGKM